MGNTESIQKSDIAGALMQNLLLNLGEENELGDTRLTSEVADNPEEVKRLKAFIEKRDDDGDTPLSVACYMGYARMVKFLLVNGANIETKDKNDRTPLTIASYKGHTQVVELLLEYKADIETKDKKGFFPLYIAAQEDHLLILRLLLNKGAKTEAKNAHGSTALTVASLKGNVSAVQTLLKYGADIEPTDSDGDTPLTLTCEMGLTGIVRLLLEYGASTEKKDNKGFFSLYNAAQEGHEQVIEMLLKYGTKIETKISSGFTALTVASAKGRTSVVKLLLDAKANTEVSDSDGHTPLAVACLVGHTNVVKLLLKYGADIETRDTKGNTPLNYSSLKGMTDVVALLLEYGADVETRCNKGSPPLYRASKKGHEQIARMLLKGGAKTESKIPSGRTSMFVACANGNTDIVKLLLEYNADIETRDSDGDTPLCIACLRGMTDIVELLLEAGADVEPRDNKGFVPLYIAAQYGHEQIVRLLLNSGAYTETSLESGFTPLCIASHECHVGIVRLLLDNRANTEAKDKRGRNPLAIAEGQGHQEVVDLLKDRKVGVNTLLLNASEEGNEHGVSSSLMKGADIETKDASGNTPLCKASFKGHDGVVSLLLERGAKTEATNNDGHFPLFVAAKNNHPYVTHCLLKNGATIDDHDASPLHVSSQCGHELVVVTLLDSKANIERKNRAGRTPLVSAAMYGQTDIINKLIKHGADCESRDNAGLSALDISVIHGQVGTVEYFMKRISDEQTSRSVAEQMVSLSAEYGQKHVISFLAQLIPKLNLDQRDASGLSPLAKAVSRGHFECVRLLHSLGATLTENELGYCRSAEIYEYFLLAGLYNPSSDLEDIKLQQYLPFANEVDWSVFEAALSPSGPKEDRKKNLSLFVNTKGVGPVRNLDGKTRNQLMQDIHDKVSNLTEIARKRWKAAGPPKLVGSTAEESMVGFPDEVDFKFTQGSVVSEDDIEDVGHVFRRYTKQDIQSNSKLFHSEFWTDIPLVKDDMVISFPTAVTGDGSASTPMMMVWPSESDPCRLAVSIDVVPSIRVDNCWPQGALHKTWMMNREALKRRGYELVAKPPSKNSRFGKRFSGQEREKLYTINFTTLEIEHIKELNPWVKNAFLLAKCLRNPVLCKVVVRDDNGEIHFVDSYISTFFLKNIFLRNVEDFLQHQRHLIEMVYVIYSQLEYYLSHAFIPLFWMPRVNVLEGKDVSAAKSHKVAAHMKSLIRDAFVEELDQEPPEDVNGKIKIPQDCQKIDLSDASGIEILSVPLKEADIASLRR